MKESYKIIDIFQPVSRSNACFLGYIPFDYYLKASYLNNDCYNVMVFKMWLENLDLTAPKEEAYFLSALPIKFMELEAAPVRAVLMSFKSIYVEDLPC